MRSPYPATSPRRAEHLDVGNGHQIYIEEGGAAHGIPVVFLHGGPGSGCKPSHRQFFHPEKYRSVLIDQRGAGKSLPFGGIEHNTTVHLAHDLEQVRNYLDIDKWVLFGGSWGAALALYYAQEYPGRVLGMVLRGTFLARRRDVDWFFSDGANRLLPQSWHEFREALGTPHDPQAYLYDAVFGTEPGVAENAARAWMRWSEQVVTYAIDNLGGEAQEPLSIAMAKTRIELHYARNSYFLRENQLLADAARVPDVPIAIIHGQRDLTCTPDAAWALHLALPGSTLRILRTAGHLSGETAMTDALLDAADAMVARLAG